NQHETTHNEWNSWQEFMKQFNDRYSINEQKEHGTEVKEENNDQNENVQSEEQDKDVEKQEDENDNNLHTFEQEVVDLTKQKKKRQQQENDKKKKQYKNVNNIHPYEQEVLELTNQEREKQGLAPLEIDSELSVVSKDKSKDMLNNQYFSHDSPTYGSPFDM